MQQKQNKKREKKKTKEYKYINKRRYTKKERRQKKDSQISDTGKKEFNHLELVLEKTKNMTNKHNTRRTYYDIYHVYINYMTGVYMIFLYAQHKK